MIFPETAFLPSDTLRSCMVLGIRFFAVTTVLQVGALITFKIVVERRERRRGRLKAYYMSCLNRALLKSGVTLEKPCSRIEYEAFTDSCIQLMSDAVPARVQWLQQGLRRCGVPEFFSASLLRSRSWIGRYRIIETLGFLQLPELRATFRSVMGSEKEHRLVISKATWALSRVCREQDLPAILKTLASPNFMSAKFNEYIFFNVIESFRGRGETDILLGRFRRFMDSDAVSLLLTKDFIQACGNACLRQAEELIIHCARRFGESPEMFIACVRAIQGTGGERLDDMVIAGLIHADWRIRAVAAKNVEKCSDRIMAYLELALGDPNYHVRMNAAVSLAQKGSAGIEMLRLQSRSSDGFIRDVSNYVLAA